MSKAEATPKPEPAEPELPDGASVQTVGDPANPSGVWHLVTFGAWQISVGPDGLLMLPRHLHPREWADFVACGSLAANVAARVVAENAERGAADDRSLPPGRAIVTEGPPPVGAMRMLTTAGPNQPPPQISRARIGRPGRGAKRAIAPPGSRV